MNNEAGNLYSNRSQSQYSWYAYMLEDRVLLEFNLDEKQEWKAMYGEISSAPFRIGGLVCFLE